MKGQVSRLSQDRSNLYSAVYQTQGAMVTDADLGQAATAIVSDVGTDDVAVGPGEAGPVEVDAVYG